MANLFSNFIKEFNRISIYSPSLHQDFYQKLIKCFSNYTPFRIISNILNEKDIDLGFDEIVNDKAPFKSGKKTETNESIEELKRPQDYEGDGIIILDDSNGKSNGWSSSTSNV